MNNNISKILMLFVALTFAGCATRDIQQHDLHYKSPYKPIEELQPGQIIHVPTGTMLTPDDLAGYLEKVRVVYVGESHRSLDHHRTQLDIIKSMHERDPNANGWAVGMEMFARPSQELLNQWINGEVDDKALYKEWIKNWGIDYEYYREIFEYLKEHKIPLIALNMTRKNIRAVTRGSMNGTQGTHGQEGTADNSGSGSHSHKHKHKNGDTERNAEKIRDEMKKDELASSETPLPEMDESDPFHKAWVEAVFTDPSHGKAYFDTFYKVQLLWDETMAETAAAYLKSPDGQDRRLIVLAGGGHVSFGFGIPKRVFRRLAEPYAVVVPVSVDIVSNVEHGTEKGAKYLDIEMPDIPLYVADFVVASKFQTIKESSPKLGVFILEDDGRVIITAISPGSPAEKSELMAGDDITKIEDVEVSEIVDLVFYLKQKKFGDTVQVTVERAGLPLEFEILLTEFP